MSKDFNFKRNRPRDSYFVKDYNNPKDKGTWKMHLRHVDMCKVITKPNKLNTKESNMKYDHFADYSWRHVEPIQKYQPDHNYPVQWNAFETTTKEMLSLGWTIDIETNRYTCRTKVIFRNAESGLMTRVPFIKGDKYIQINQLFAVKNYKMKAAVFTETIAAITEEMIPYLLDSIREIKRSKVSDFVLEQKKVEIENKVVELGKYLHNQQKEVA